MKLPDDFWPEPSRLGLSEFLGIPEKGWNPAARRRYIAIQLGRMVIEGAVYVLALVAIFGAVLLVWASQQ